MRLFSLCTPPPQVKHSLFFLQSSCGMLEDGYISTMLLQSSIPVLTSSSQTLTDLLMMQEESEEGRDSEELLLHHF